MRDDDVLFVDGDFCLRLNDVDWRQRADFDAALVVVERPFGQRERLTLRRQVVDRVRQIPVCVLDVSGRLHDDRLQLRIGKLADLRAELYLLPHLIDRQISHQRLRVVQRDIRLKLGTVVVEQVRGGKAGAAPVSGVPAAPRQQLVDFHASRNQSVVHAGGASGERAR